MLKVLAAAWICGFRDTEWVPLMGPWEAATSDLALSQVI